MYNSRLSTFHERKSVVFYSCIKVCKGMYRVLDILIGMTACDSLLVSTRV